MRAAPASVFVTFRSTSFAAQEFRPGSRPTSRSTVIGSHFCFLQRAFIRIRQSLPSSITVCRNLSSGCRPFFVRNICRIYMTRNAIEQFETAGRSGRHDTMFQTDAKRLTKMPRRKDRKKFRRRHVSSQSGKLGETKFPSNQPSRLTPFFKPDQALFVRDRLILGFVISEQVPGPADSADSNRVT